MNKLDTWHKSLLVSHMKDQHMVLKRYLKFTTCKLLWYFSLNYIFLEIYYKLKTRIHNLCVLWHWKYKEIRDRFIYLFIYLFLFFRLPPPRLEFSICRGTLNIKLYCIVDVFLINSQIKGVKESQGPTQGVCFTEVSIFNLKCLLRKSQRYCRPHHIGSKLLATFSDMDSFQ